MSRPKGESTQPKRRLPPAKSLEDRENQLIALAVDVAEQRLLDGTASNQLVCHFLSLGSVKAKLELEKVRNENELLKAKSAALEAGRHTEELYQNALEAMRAYSGKDDE